MTLTDYERRFLTALAQAPEPMSTRELMSSLGTTNDAYVGGKGRLFEALGLLHRYRRLGVHGRPFTYFALTEKGRRALQTQPEHRCERLAWVRNR